MATNYVRKTTKYNKEDMVKALEAVKSGAMGYKKAAQTFNLKRETIRDQFPAEVANTAATLTSKRKHKEEEEDSDYSNSMMNDVGFSESEKDPDDSNQKELNSSLYQRLGHNVYRLLTEKGMSSKSLVKLIQESAMGKNKDVTDPEQATSRISGSASNQQEDNGNMKIIIIVVLLSIGFLLILLVIFLLMRRHDKIVKAKAAERAVRFENNHHGRSSLGGTTTTTTTTTIAGAMTRLTNQERERPPPPIPASRPPPVDDSYLTPKDINDLYTEVLRPNGTAASSSNHNNYHAVSAPSSSASSNHSCNSEFGACGRSAETEERSSLMTGISPSNTHAYHHSTAAHGPTESCACAAVTSPLNPAGSEYMAMNSLVSKDSIGSESTDKLIEPEDKHTYSNIHLDGKENGVVENLYESLP